MMDKENPKQMRDEYIERCALFEGFDIEKLNSAGW